MRKDFTGTLCDFYIVAVAAALPLYTRGTYALQGDSKYALFRNISLFCLGLAGAAGAVEWALKKRTGIRRQTPAFCPVDWCMLCYGGWAAVSAVCSSYGSLAWTGSPEWYMGALSQLLFVGIYFFVSRTCRRSGWTVSCWETGFFLVVLLGFLSRLGLDPLGLRKGFGPETWEYSHLISTVGNINWFCGYCAVALSLPVAGYLKAKRAGKRRLLFAVSVLGLALLGIQGSDTGFVLAAACLGVCLLKSRGNPEGIGRTLLLAAGTAFALSVYGRAAAFLGEKALKSLPADGPGIEVFLWNGWWILGLACLGLYDAVRRLEKGETAESRREKIRKGIWLGLVISGIAAGAAAGALYLARLTGTEGWLTGRGALWKLAWRSFLQGDLKQKLLGAGPDCFGVYVYSHFSPTQLPAVEGHFADAVFVNAHNQGLNHLVNMGIPGLCGAAALYFSAVRRYRGSLAGMLGLVLYGVNSLVSFQQVMSTPLFFLLLGICESVVRRQENERSAAERGEDRSVAL